MNNHQLRRTLLKRHRKIKIYALSSLTVALFTLASFKASAQKITLKIKNGTLGQVVNAIGKQTDLTFLYNDLRLKDIKGLNVDVVQTDIQTVLETCLKNSGLTFSIADNTIVIRPVENRGQESIIINGVVLDANRKPFPKASVSVKGTTLKTVSDNNGKFSLQVKDLKDVILVVTAVGKKTKEIPFSNQKNLEVILQDSETKLEEVVIRTGMFDLSKESFSGSVTTLNNKEIKQLTNNNILTALAIADPSFKMNLSNIVGSNPNAVADYTIRGGSSMGNYMTNDAVVLRGDYVNRPNLPLFVLDDVIGVDVNLITDLDPDRVMSITLLKDASATSIYGSKASNGVVVVYTKKPESGKLRVSYNGNYGIQLPDLSDYNLANAREKLAVEELAGFFSTTGSGNSLNTQLAYANLKYDVERGVNTNWLELPLRNAFTQMHGLNLEGGSDDIRYKVYLGAGMTPGVMKNTDMNRQSAAVDLIYNAKKLIISNKASVNYVKGKRESDFGGFDIYSRQNPYYTPFDENGTIKKYLNSYPIYDLSASDTKVMNPLWNTLFDSRNEVRDFSFTEALGVQYRPEQNLVFNMNFNITKTFGRTDIFKSAYHTESDYAASPAQKGNYLYTSSEGNRWELNLTGSYNKHFGDDHLLSLNMRGSIGEDDTYGLNINTKGFPNDRLSEVFMGTTVQSLGGTEGVSRSVGMVFKGAYSYKSKYSLDMTGTVDASTNFGRNNRWAPFWSTGLRWNIHNENFLKGSFLNELVLRGTYGITGANNSFSSWQALQMYTYANSMSWYASSDVVGALLLGMGNPDLKWQQTDNKNLGLDFSMLDGYLSGRFEYYYNYTKNTIIDFTLAPSTGVSSIKDNMGNISNRGFETSIRATLYRDNSKQAFWNITLNAGQNRSRIEKISESMEKANADFYAKNQNDLTKPLPQYVNGASLNSLWGMHSRGIDPQTGLEVFQRRDGSLTTIWSSKDVVEIGNMDPKIAGAIYTTFGYKGLNVSLAASYTYGGQMYNNTLADKVENANLRNNVDKRVLYDRWTIDSPDSRFKKISSTSTDRTNSTSRFVMDNNSLTLNTINLSYRMSKQEQKFLQNLGLSSATFGMYLRDILYISTIKRERGITYPFARQVSMSMNLVF